MNNKLRLESYLISGGLSHMKKAKYVNALTVSFTADVYQRIKEESDRQEISMGEYVRRVIQKEMENDNNRKHKT
jgi:hypothetical protein